MGVPGFEQPRQDPAAVNTTLSAADMEFRTLLDQTVESSAKERFEHFNFHERITDLRTQIEALDNFTTEEEVQWLMKHLSKKSAQDILARLHEQDKKIEDIRANQQELIRLLQSPVMAADAVTRAGLVSAISSFSVMRRELDDLRRGVELSKGRSEVDEQLLKDVGSLQSLRYELPALQSNVEALQSTVQTLNKRIDLLDPSTRILAVETKVKEVLEYLRHLQSSMGKFVQLPRE